MDRWSFAVAGLLMVWAGPAWAEEQDATPPRRRLPEVRVEGAAIDPFPEDVEDARIYAGKKVTVAEFDAAPPVQANNYRQAFGALSGLLVAEQTVPSHANFNYRGVGDPHESEYLLVTKDGMPIVSDWFGYSTLYYQPPLESVERVELIRGGSALLYGPQPGPVLNFVSRRPPVDTAFTGRTQHTFGSNGLYSTYNSIGGTSGSFGYLGALGYRRDDGARPNADYGVTYANLKGVHKPDESSEWTVNLDAYASESGEAGRLSLSQYLANRDFTRTPSDRLWVERIMPSVTYQQAVSDQTLWVTKGWAGQQDRFSRRASGSSTNLDLQEFAFAGLDTRVSHAWDAAEEADVTTAGAVLYVSDSPRSRRRGAELHATTGPTRFELDRRTLYGALFAEHLARFGPLSLIPAFRLDVVDMDVRELSNVEVTRSLIQDSYTDVVPLGALGAAYDLSQGHAWYGNVSQGYRPKEYDDLANPTSSAQRPPSDLDESRTWTYETGLRGTPAPWAAYDMSVFYVDYDNYVETQDLGGGNSERSNSGRARYRGVDLAYDVDLIGAYDAAAGTAHGERLGALRFYQNLSLLDAEFVSGSNNRRVPAYAPVYMLKTGAVFRRDGVQVALTGLLVDDYYWQDSNAAGSVGTTKAAAHTVWDLETEVALAGDAVRLLAGVNNLFDEDYYSRVRSDGIEPAARRTYYAGVSIGF